MRFALGRGRGGGLSDAALVVRGGYHLARSVPSAAEKTVRDFGRPGLSVFAAELELPELVRRAGDRLPQVWLNLSTVGELRRWFEVEWTLAWPHATVWLPDLSVPTFERFCAAFPTRCRNPERGASWPPNYVPVVHPSR